MALNLSLLPAVVHSVEDPDLDADRIEFVVGNAHFVLLHEVAHMLIHEFNIPVLGNEEEAADTLAATTLIRLDKQQASSDHRFIRMLVMAGDANRILWTRGVEMRSGAAAYWANHPLSVQRATRIACLVLGSDPEAFAGLPELVDMPFFRAGWCEEEYAAAEAGRVWVRQTVPAPKRLRRGSSISVNYEDPADDDHAFVEGWLREQRILENAAGYVDAHVRMPDDVSFTAKSCGSPNAYWDEEARSVLLCYELLLAFYDLSAEQSVKTLEAELRAMAP